MHELHADVKEKIVVVMDGRRFGVIPISNKQMYVWASLKEPLKKWILKDDQAKAMYQEFKNVEGFLKDIVEDLNSTPYVHYTAVEEVNITGGWHKGRIVLLGDSAHASVPFMAQGGAMALQDAVVLSNLISKNISVEDALTKYYSIRKPVVDTVQQMSRKIGSTYSDNVVDLNRAQSGLDSFYGNKQFFN
jgi:2-polyprenyl-6-methoxyphenol hydroxylase-like FAD-dependent oxidoreductase